MKRKTTGTIILGIIFCLAIPAYLVIRDLDSKRRFEIAEAGISHLAAYTEIFKADHDRYPSSLDELQQEPPFKDLVHGILHDAFKNTYAYEPLTNGFMITATASSPLWYKPDIIKKTYKPGEAR